MADQEEIHKKSINNDPKERRESVHQLGTDFRSLPDKRKAWEDLHRLTTDEDSIVRSGAAEALVNAFQQLPEKQKAWEDLIKLATDENFFVRVMTVVGLGNAFQQLPDKQKAWEDLIKLATDENFLVRVGVADALGNAFQQLPDKQKAWKDLQRLTTDEDIFVQSVAAVVLGKAFQHIPEKQKAWEYLQKLTTDEHSDVRGVATVALGNAFQQLPDKQKAWKDLQRLTTDEDSDVRIRAHHSLGKISIYRASRAENDEAYLNELEKAINFFEKASNEATFYNPSSFCLPFYRSFYVIIQAEKRKARDEVDKYLTEAKEAIGESKNKKLLFEAVENLANALKEVQNLGNINLEAKKGELNFYRKYCEQASELMKDTEIKSPFATETIRKGLPLLDRRLKELLEEIKREASIACRESRGTDAEETACKINKEIQNWEVANQEEMGQNIEKVVSSLKLKIPDNPENIPILDKIESLKNEKDLTKQYEILSTVITSIPTAVYNVSNVSIENSNYIVVNSNNNNISVSSQDTSQSKSGVIDSFATRAGFTGFFILEILNVRHPLSTNDHIICLSAIVIFSIFMYIKSKR